MQRDRLAGWIDLYERAWRTPGIELLQDLFDPKVRYSAAPFERPMHGLAAIASFWEAEREGPDEHFDLAWEPVALEGDVGVARVEVHYAGPPERVYRDLWIVTLGDDGRCIAFEEWPFFPGRRRVSGESEAGVGADGRPARDVSE